MTHQCVYCNKSFVRETSLFKHLCEKKRRWLAKDEPASRIGFSAFCSFWEIHQRSGKQQTHDTFIQSPYYTAFRKFGHYCVEVRALNSDSFVRWLLKNNHPIDRWCRDTLYTTWLIDYLTVEDVSSALARSVEYSIEWGDDTGMQPKDILRYGGVSRLVQAISTGRLSPWAIYCSVSGQGWLATLHDTQLALVWDYLNADRWSKVLEVRADDKQWAQEILTNAGW